MPTKLNLVFVFILLGFIGFTAYLLGIIGSLSPRGMAAPIKTSCDYPPPGYTLVATGSADGKPVCAYHKTLGWGDAK